jgi:hypothetical protein
MGRVPDRHARDARWVEPRLAGEVAFTDMSVRGGGRAQECPGLWGVVQ